MYCALGPERGAGRGEPALVFELRRLNKYGKHLEQTLRASKGHREPAAEGESRGVANCQRAGTQWLLGQRTEFANRPGEPAWVPWRLLNPVHFRQGVVWRAGGGGVSVVPTPNPRGCFCFLIGATQGDECLNHFSLINNNLIQNRHYWAPICEVLSRR